MLKDMQENDIGSEKKVLLLESAPNFETLTMEHGAYSKIAVVSSVSDSRSTIQLGS